MATTADFKNGLYLDFEGKPCSIVWFQHVKPGKGPAFVKSKLRNLENGRILEKTWNAGEKIDVITWSDNASEYIREALSPAEVIKVDIDGKKAKVYVSEDQQSIAIGKQGQNVRLASKLTGFDIDIELQKATAKKKKKNVEDSLLSAIEETSEEIDTLTEDSAEQVEDAAEKATESALGETSEE